mmetsp:Transcript_16774/g.50095  ORF Transcript_16774/g.50095 Transcript_16774/m.50095 type:complete len:299 (+) Transcript_16774:101-997(+)
MRRVLAMLAATARAAAAPRLDDEAAMAAYLASHPSRAYFPHLFRYGPYATALEVGVAGGRFAEHFLTAAAPAIRRYDMIEPFPQATLRAKTSEDPLLDRVVLKLERRRLGEPYAVYTGRPFSSSIPWHRRGIGLGVDKRFFRALSTDPEVLARIPLGSVDFVYLDGAHDYVNVKAEMEPYWARVAPGGVLAGHDYCHYPGDRTLACRGCASVPHCRKYALPGKGRGIAKNQRGVVRAVQEWLAESHPRLRVRHTLENFTRASLESDGMNYDLVITGTYNPSWYIFKPGTTRSSRATGR